MATRIVEIMKTRTCSHICWTIFDIPPSQLLRQPGYEQTIAQCVTWPMIEVRVGFGLNGRAIWDSTTEQPSSRRCE